MPRTIERLSARKVPTLTKRGTYADGGGLYLRVAKGGSRQWIYRYRQHGKLHDMGLGPVHTFTLAQARERARALRVKRYEGIDPLEEKRRQHREERLRQASMLTFRECAEQFINAHEAEWRGRRTSRDRRQSLEAYVYPVLGDLPAARVDTAIVLRALEPIWQTKTTTARNVRNRIEQVLEWPRVRGYREGDNPARWKAGEGWHMHRRLGMPG